MDLLKFLVEQGNGVKGLSEKGLKSLPQEYIQPLDERLDLGQVVDVETIPIIDMSKIDDPKVENAICNAAEEWGFFHVINHGVPLEVMEKIKEATHKFFNLPAEEKKKYMQAHSPTKNVRYGTSFFPTGERSLEWKDYLSLMYTTEEEAETYWPKECKDEVLEYMRKSDLLTRKLLGALLRRLNIKQMDKKKEEMLMGCIRINLNYYPICPDPDQTVGVGRHSDVSSLTVLLQDDVGGLYVRGNKGRDCWIPVSPISGSFVINIGDALQIMSNGRYKSVEHRVFAKQTSNRISVPIFVNPRPDIVIAPFDEVLESGERAIYKPVLYSDYVKHFFRKGHDGKMTVDFAKIQ